MGKPDQLVHIYDRQDHRFIPDPSTGRPYRFVDDEGNQILGPDGEPTPSGRKFLDQEGNIRVAQHDCYGPCAIQAGWLCSGRAKDVPKHCRSLVGRYHNTAVWVMPANRNELTKLTLTILDYAVNSPPQQITKEVVRYLDALGDPATVNEHAQRVTATIPIDAPSDVVRSRSDIVAELRSLAEEKNNILQFLEADPNRKAQLRALLSLPASDEAVQQRLFDINKRIDALNRVKERLSEQIQRPTPGAVSDGIVGLRLRLDTLTPPPPAVLRGP
jgi:hypothetical protein